MRERERGRDAETQTVGRGQSLMCLNICDGSLCEWQWFFSLLILGVLKKLKV